MSLCAQAKMAERGVSFSRPAILRFSIWQHSFEESWKKPEYHSVKRLRIHLEVLVLRSVKTMNSCLLAGFEAASTCCSHFKVWSCSQVNKIPAGRGLLIRKGVELVLLGIFPALCQSDWQLLKFSSHFREQAAAGDETV